MVATAAEEAVPRLLPNSASACAWERVDRSAPEAPPEELIVRVATPLRSETKILAVPSPAVERHRRPPESYSNDSCQRPFIPLAVSSPKAS